jgi:hypothetical protein
MGELLECNNRSGSTRSHVHINPVSQIRRPRENRARTRRLVVTKKCACLQSWNRIQKMWLVVMDPEAVEVAVTNICGRSSSWQLKRRCDGAKSCRCNGMPCFLRIAMSGSTTPRTARRGMCRWPRVLTQSGPLSDTRRIGQDG